MCDRNDSPNNINCKSTPPTSKKVRNPFDKALIERLHKPICSPGMCKIYKRKDGSFRWDIDQACMLVPADIVACNSQFEPSPDPALEKIAEEATEQFFSQELVMPSPLTESSKKVKPLQTFPDSLPMTSFNENDVMKNVSVQTVLTLPPELPPDIEKILQSFCTFTQEQNISGDYEITASGSLRRKLFYEEHSDEHYDSEQTDEELQVEPRPPSSYDEHERVIFSPEVLSQNLGKGMKRCFGTPLSESASSKPCYRNKILDVVDYAEPCCSPIEFRTPKRDLVSFTSSNSLASNSISPVTKVTSSDEEKNNFTSPESEAMATCLDCIASEPNNEKKGPCFCKKAPNASILKRSASLKESPPRSRKSSFSFSEKRSLSMSSLHRSRSVQKLDFSTDMSIDGSFHCNADSESSLPKELNERGTPEATWSIDGEASIQQLVKEKSQRHKPHDAQPDKQTTIDINILDETPIKGKCKSNILSHEISKIRALSPLNMSLDNSLDSDNPLNLEDKKIDFNNVDLKFLTENASQFECTANATKVGGDSSTSFKRVDSGFNENTFYTNASSYYESAIKPSELTVTNVSKLNTNAALKEISNVPWMRLDSGFKDENSADSTQFYNENSKVNPRICFSEVRVEDKENVEDFDRFLLQSSGKNDPMSMSEVFNEDITFNCNFSSTPSKNKSRQVNS